MRKHKNKTTMNMNTDELRVNSLENGLYFYLLDLANERGLDTIDYLLNCGISLQHSNQVNNSGRNAIFLNLGVTDFTASLFNGGKRCHITFDRNFYEYDSNTNPDRLKWHYSHYTEEYIEAGATVHIYFNSMGKPIEYTLSSKTSKGQITRLLTQDEIGIIHVNITFASEVISTLLSSKNQRIQHLSSTATQISQQISRTLIGNANDDDSVFMLNELYANYESARNLAQRYADTLLMFTDVQLQRELQESKNQRSPADELPNVDAKAKQGEASASHIVATNKIIFEKSKASIQNLKQRISELFCYDTILQHLPELYKIHRELILIAKDASSAQKKQIGDLLSKVENIDIKKIISSKIKPDNITLRYLQKNFYIIEAHLDDIFYIETINAAIEAKDVATRTKFSEICNFLFEHSIDYRDFIKKANIITNARENQLSILWLANCFKTNNPELFAMLLSHGLNLGAHAMEDHSAQDSVYNSTFKMLMHKFCLSYLRIACLAQKDKKFEDARQDMLKRVEIFLSIMLQPEFIAGAEYEQNLRNRLTKEAIILRIQNKFTLKRAAEKSNGRMVVTRNPDDIVDRVGLLSILDYVIKYMMPIELVSLVAANIKSDQVKLENIATNFGNIFSDNNFSILVNFDSELQAKYSSNITCLPCSDIPSFSNDIITMHNQPICGNINLRIFITERPDGEQDSPQRLARMHEILFNLNKLFTDKMQSEICKRGSKELLLVAEKMLNFDSQNINDHFFKKQSVCRILGALIILVNLNEDKIQSEQRVLILRALLKLCNISESSNPLISQSYAFAAYRFYLEAKLITDQNLFSALDTEMRKHGEPSKFNELAAQYYPIPEVSKQPTPHKLCSM